MWSEISVYIGATFCFQKSDDGDSGNDEPADGLYAGDRGNLYNNHEGVPAVPPLDSLNNRIELLSNFSDRQKQDSFTIHIENLPPEGNFIFM